VKRAVWERDGGRCQWPLASGGVCGSTVRVEIDHVVPRARGGPTRVDNLRCLCRRHNDRAAREAFGGAWMDRFTAREPVARYRVLRSARDRER
jgi:5-methylcytosine-specific restriction endonuclease McrA